MGDHEKKYSERNFSESSSFISTCTYINDNSEQNVSYELEQFSGMDTYKEEGVEEDEGKSNNFNILSHHITEEPSQIIYKSRNKKRQTASKKRKYHKNVIRLKPSINKINRRQMKKNLESYIERKSANLYKNNNQINSNLITGSLCKILKEVPAKESLIDDLPPAVEKVSKNNEEDTPLLCLKESLSTNNTSCNNSLNATTFDIANESSDNFVSDKDSVLIVVDEPIRRNVINVSRAQVDSITFFSRKSTPTPSYNPLVNEKDFISSVDTLVNRNPLPSNPGSVETLGNSSEQGGFYSSSKGSVQTLIDDGMKSLTFVAKDSYASSLNSEQSSITHQMKNFDILFNENYPKASISYTQKTLMNTVIDLGMFPNMTACGSSSNLNDVIVTGRLQTNYNSLAKNAREKNTAKDDHNNGINCNAVKNVVQKSLNPTTDINIKPKPVIKLLDEDTINDLLKLNPTYKPDAGQAEWCSDYPTNIAELWEQLVTTLDSRIEKLEESLTEKITEMKQSLSMFDKFISKAEIKQQERVKKTDKLNIEKDTRIPSDGLERDLQCEFFKTKEQSKRHAIAVEIAQPSVFLKDTKEIKYTIKPSFENLKPAVEAAGDSHDFTNFVIEKPPSVATHTNHSVRTKLSSVMCFLKENAVVLAGVPIFIATWVCVYFAIVLIVT